MPIKPHTMIRKGDRIVEGHGKKRVIYKVREVVRWPVSNCRYGTHVTTDEAWNFCYTQDVTVL